MKPEIQKRAKRPAPRGVEPRRWAAPIAGFVGAVLVAGAGLGYAGCRSGEAPLERTDEPEPSGATSATAESVEPAGGEDELEKPAPPAGSSEAVAAAAPAREPGFDPDAPYDGPLLGAMALQTPVYPEPRFSDERLGYIRQGGKVPVDPKPIKKPNCKQGWYRLLEGGFVCGKYSTLDLENPRVKLGIRAPDLSAILPYQYAYNRFHGTPLYKTLPTREDMLRYEPYLAEKKPADKGAKEEPATKKAEGGGDEAAKKAALDTSSTKPASDAAREGRRSAKRVPGDEGAGGAPSARDDARAEQAAAAPSPDDAQAAEAEPAEPEAPKAWWQSDEKKPAVSLADLEKDADGNLSKRMVKGFFVAIDKSFGWNDRLWYRTTGGLVAPADRMYINKAPESKGIDWPEGAKRVGFVLSDKARKYTLSSDGKTLKDVGKLELRAAVPLTDEEREIGGTKYLRAVEGYWVKSQQCAVTEAGPKPDEVGEHERWVDVDLSSKTIVLFEGTRPVYTALVSPGKRSKEKKKNHATPTGSWRIREKHIAVTMDGDGASGDLPYSIEDVPFVAYYKGSYALHGAFWHSNFGREMSHGCVNLSPRDARVVFDFVEPRLPKGWHAVWATKAKPGSLVVVHD